MNDYNKFSCFIMGEGEFPLRCAEILLDHDRTIYGSSYYKPNLPAPTAYVQKEAWANLIDAPKLIRRQGR